MVACSKRAEQNISASASDDSSSMVNVAAPTPPSTSSTERDEFFIQARRVPLPSASSAGSGPEPPDYLPPPVPPPRKKRGKNRPVLGSAGETSPVVPSPGSDVFVCPAAPGLPPACTPDHAVSASLDLESVVQGLSVVRSTDDEASRGGRGPLATPAQHHSASLPTKKLEVSESPGDSSFYKR